jgi:hypothetical protein
MSRIIEDFQPCSTKEAAGLPRPILTRRNTSGKLSVGPKLVSYAARQRDAALGAFVKLECRLTRSQRASTRDSDGPGVAHLANDKFRIGSSSAGRLTELPAYAQWAQPRIPGVGQFQVGCFSDTSQRGLTQPEPKAQGSRAPGHGRYSGARPADRESSAGEVADSMMTRILRDPTRVTRLPRSLA